MPKKKYNKILYISLLGIFFILILSNYFIEVKGTTKTLDDNEGIALNYQCFANDELSVVYTVLSGPYVDVYIRNQSTVILLGSPSSNIVKQAIDSSSGILTYIIPAFGDYSVVLINNGGSQMTLEYTVSYNPKGMIGLISLILMIVIPIAAAVAITIVVTVILVRKRNKRNQEQVFQKVKKLEQGE